MTAALTDVVTPLDLARPLGVRRPGRDPDDDGELNLLLLVDDPTTATAVRVRWRVPLRRYPPWRWRCSLHGRQNSPSCEHTLAAALYISRTALGIDPLSKGTTP